MKGLELTDDDIEAMYQASLEAESQVVSEGLKCISRKILELAKDILTRTICTSPARFRKTEA
jgi:hypothetical protein